MLYMVEDGKHYNNSYSVDSTDDVNKKIKNRKKKKIKRTTTTTVSSKNNDNNK